MDVIPVAVLGRAYSNLLAQRLAVADLPRDEGSGFGLINAQQELGRRHGREHRGLLVAIDPAQLSDALEPQHGGEPALSSASYQRLKLRLPAKHRQLIHHYPDPSTIAGGVQQAADNEVEPEVRER